MVKVCGGIVGIGGLISIPYWLNFSALRRMSHYSDLMFRIGGIEVGRQFRFSSVWKTYARHFMWIVVLAVTTMRRVPRTALFLISLLVAYFMVVNVQVVLGFSPQPDHWYRETFLPILLAVGAVGVWLWERYAARHISARCAALCVFVFLGLFFVQAFYGQYLVSRDGVRRWGVEGQYADAYMWLSKDTNAGSVVGSVSEETNRDIALFTHNLLFLPSGGTTLVSNEEIWNRIYTLSALWGLTPKQTQIFVQNKTYYLFQDYYRSRSPDSYFKTAPTPVISEQEIHARITRYANLQPVDSSVAPYPLDYLFVSPHEEAIAPTPSTFARFHLVYDAGGVRIYKIKP